MHALLVRPIKRVPRSYIADGREPLNRSSALNSSVLCTIGPSLRDDVISQNTDRGSEAGTLPVVEHNIKCGAQNGQTSAVPESLDPRIQPF